MAERDSPTDHGEEEELEQDKDTNTPDDRDTATARESPDVDSSEDQQLVQLPTQPEEQSECPGCQSMGILTLPCGHKLCPTCIELSQGELGQAGCTICYGSQLMDSVLHTLLEALFHGQPRRPGVTAGAAEEHVRATEGGGRALGVVKEELCVAHGEMLSVFCLEEGEPLCQQCQTDEHEAHQCCSIQEAVLDCKRELRSAVRGLQEQLESLTSIRQTWEDTAAHIKSQSVQTAQVLREEFEKMHVYLRDEEATLMSQLKQEEEEKGERMKEKIDRLNNDIRELTSSIRETEEAMGFDDFLFLKNYKKASERAQCRVEEPEEESGALLDVAKHQSCVQHHVWDKMLRIIQYFPVTMDPNTGSVCLGVTPDLSSVFVCEEQTLPDNPERFVSPQSILGSEGFSSGRHSWEVEVGDNSHWSLGVASESVHRKDWSNSGLNPGPALDSDIDLGGSLWTVSLSSGEFWASPGHSAPLRLRRKPSKVRVQLDWERGCLTFSDANDNGLIYRFKKQWSGTLRPYFSTTCSKHPLKITAGRVTVNIE
ncbi:Tripartite motif-containing protein 35 [Larimichthys crocea]|uniref:Tripartite motif-containing protein 35 n=1 Tax=Larimichthys crocea TaxID=215358 RepID=A0A0F8B4Y8_LARCR|nr:tripartite motif-containing protein 35 [Larimichthys crocea]KAE8289483.1 Tripartite motif-containing protein 35 [Larimichthys crocea]